MRASSFQNLSISLSEDARKTELKSDVWREDGIVRSIFFFFFFFVGGYRGGGCIRPKRIFIIILYKENEMRGEKKEKKTPLGFPLQSSSS